MTDLLPVYHHTDGCGHVAFYLRHRVSDGSMLTASNVVWPHGRAAVASEGGEAGDLVLCFVCHGHVASADILNATDRVARPVLP